MARRRCRVCSWLLHGGESFCARGSGGSRRRAAGVEGLQVGVLSSATHAACARPRLALASVRTQCRRVRVFVEATQPSSSVRALALFGVLVVAKLLAVSGRDLPISVWTPLALYWQDALVALLFAAADFGLRRKPALSWGLFWMLVAYTAINVILTRILSSPLTLPMARATGGALADSITYYLTPTNIALMATVVLAAGGLAAVARKPQSTRTRKSLGALAVLAVA